MSTVITSLIDEIAADLPGAPIPTIERQFQRTAIDFCQRSWIWQTAAAPITTIAGRAQYQVSVDQPHSVQVHGILTMVHRDQLLTPKTEAQLDQDWPRWREQEAKRAIYFVPEQFGAFRLVPYPDETVSRAITNIHVVLYPDRDVSTLPDALVDEWYEPLLDGVRARLMKMPGREWTDVNMAAVAAQSYEDGVNSAKHRLVQGWGATNHTVPKRPLPGMP